MFGIQSLGIVPFLFCNLYHCSCLWYIIKNLFLCFLAWKPKSTIIKWIAVDVNVRIVVPLSAYLWTEALKVTLSLLNTTETLACNMGHSLIRNTSGGITFCIRWLMMPSRLSQVNLYFCFLTSSVSFFLLKERGCFTKREIFWPAHWVNYIVPIAVTFLFTAIFSHSANTGSYLQDFCLSLRCWSNK